MTRIRLGWAVLLLVLASLWLAAEPILQAGEFFALRNAMVNFTGILGMGVMSAGLILALRPGFLERPLNGLDKMYRLHRWFGITGLVLFVLHWLWSEAPKWLVALEWLARPTRVRPPPPTDPVELFFRSQRGLAEQIGEWAFYAAVVLILLALWKRIPYRLFFVTHRVLAVVYLLLVFHAVVLLPFPYWSEPLGIVMALLMAGGTAGAVTSLFRRIGLGRRAVGEIEELQHHADNRVLKVVIRLKDHWLGHDAGQFAFVTFDDEEGPHPFTISSAWKGDGRLVFLIKGIGDHTESLPQTLRVGDLVTVEGPYGRFDFAGAKPRQIWVAGGIGITPFVARLQALASWPDGKAIDLFYCTSAPDEGFIARVRHYAEAARVRLHLLVTPKDGQLTADRLRQAVPEWNSADIWFCGPAGFGQALRRDFTGHGLPAGDFHQELFNMR